MKKLIVIYLLIILTNALLAQEEGINLSGNLSIDSKISFSATKQLVDDDNKIVNRKKSPFLAGLFSFVVPGAGEFYAESYLKSALFFAAEVAAISVGIIYDGKGDDQTEVFQNYANERWDAAKYARWTIDNLEDHLNPILENNLSASDYSDLFYDEERTRVNWNVLNELESDIGGWYSHRLERYGEQQYYEMIGKYPQFNPGWDDFDESSKFTYTNTNRDPVTAHFDYYSGLRGKANDFYNIASTAVVIVVVNHILSAADAAWSASRYNKTLSLNMSLEKENIGFTTIVHPQLNMKLNF